MPLPFVLSPFLRPYLREGALVVDNYVSGIHRRLDAAEAAVVRALWPGQGIDARLEAAFTALGAEAFEAALGRLGDAAMVFVHEGAAELALDAALDRGLAAVPFVDQIELTNHCPMKCGFCPRGIEGGMSRPKGFMARALFERLLSQLAPGQAQWRPLELHHLGESLLHPELPAFVALASAAGLPTEMSCNPALLTPELARALLDAGLRRLVLSFDGMDAATMEGLRGPAARHDRAVRDLEALLTLAAAHPTPPRVVIQMIDLEANRGQQAEFLARWGGTGLPFVTAYVKDLDGPDPATGEAHAAPLTHLCTYPWRSVVVLWDGRVVPCCRDADGALVLGDLNRQSLAEIWAAAPARALRMAHRRRVLPAGHPCAECAWRRASFVAAAPHRHPDGARPDPLSW